MVGIQLEDPFALERAEWLYNLSWFSLTSEPFRTQHKIKIKDINLWLKQAFILSSEFSNVFEKVARLLCVLHIIPSNVPKQNLCAFYFHQASISANVKVCCKTRFGASKEEDFNSHVI